MSEKLRIAMFGQKRLSRECLLNKQKQRSIVKKDQIFTLNIPKIRCKMP